MNVLPAMWPDYVEWPKFPSLIIIIIRTGRWLIVQRLLVGRDTRGLQGLLWPRHIDNLLR